MIAQLGRIFVDLFDILAGLCHLFHGLLDEFQCLFHGGHHLGGGLFQTDQSILDLTGRCAGFGT